MRGLSWVLVLALGCKDGGKDPDPVDDTDPGVDTDVPDVPDDTDEPPYVDPGPDADALRDLADASEVPLRGRAEGGLLVTLEMDVPLPLDPLVDPVDSLLDFFETYRELYRLDDPRRELRPLTAGGEGPLDAWAWRQHRAGVEILGADLTAIVRLG